VRFRVKHAGESLAALERRIIAAALDPYSCSRFLRIRQGSCITAGMRRTDMSQHGVERAIGKLVTDEAAS